MTLVVPATLGLGAGFSLVLLAFSWVAEDPGPVRTRWSPVLARREAAWLAFGLGSALGAYALTGWIAGGVLAGVAVAVSARGRAVERERAAGVETTRAAAAWAGMLRSTLAAASGVEEAILATAPIAPARIRTETMALAARMRGLEPLEPALKDFAAALGDNPTADLVVSALILSTKRQARDLGAVLDAVAAAARADAAMRNDVEASRARLRAQKRVIGFVVLGLGAYLFIGFRGFLSAYDTPTGQVVLLALGAVAGLSLLGYQRMGAIDVPRAVPVGLGAHDKGVDQ